MTLTVFDDARIVGRAQSEADERQRVEADHQRRRPRRLDPAAGS